MRCLICFIIINRKYHLRLALDINLKTQIDYIINYYNLDICDYIICEKNRLKIIDHQSKIKDLNFYEDIELIIY